MIEEVDVVVDIMERHHVVVVHLSVQLVGSFSTAAHNALLMCHMVLLIPTFVTDEDQTPTTGFDLRLRLLNCADVAESLTSLLLHISS